jgi:hypothetical protein
MTPAVAGTASAAACEGITGKSFASDYAWSTDVNGDCGTVKVRHSFNPAGSITALTAWVSDAHHPRSVRASELRSSEHVL